MRRTVTFFLLCLALLSAALFAGAAPDPDSPPPIPTPDRPLAGYRLAAWSPDDALAFLKKAITDLTAPAGGTDPADLLAQIDIIAREVRGEVPGDSARRAEAAWRAAQAYHTVGQADESLGWVRPALLDSLRAGMVTLAPPPHAFALADFGIGGEVAAHEDLDADGTAEWLVWLRFDAPPHFSVALALEPDYTLMPVEGDWPQAAGDTLLVEAVSDLNADGRPEIAISTYACGDIGCRGELLIFGWREGRFISLVESETGTRGIRLQDAQWSLSDADGDGRAEMTRVADRMDTFGWGCTWEEVSVYAWDPAAGTYTPELTTPAYAHDPPDPRCLMAMADRAIDGTEYSAAIEHLDAILAMPAAELAGLGADFAAFVTFRRGIAHALVGDSGAAVRDMEAAAQQGSAFMQGLASAFLAHYGDGATFHTACAVAAHYAFFAEEAYDLKPVAVYGRLSPVRVCRGHEEIQRRIVKGEWNTTHPLKDQLDKAGIPMLVYHEANIDADPEPEAVALTQTDFPYLWLFDAQSDGSIRAVRIATVKLALDMHVFSQDANGDGAPEGFIMVEIRDVFESRCQTRDRATLLYAIRTTAAGFEHLLPPPGFVTHCGDPDTLRQAVQGGPQQFSVTNNLGVLEPVSMDYIWTREGYVRQGAEATAAGGPVSFVHPTPDEAARLAEAMDAMLERGDLAAAQVLLAPLRELPPGDTVPAFRRKVAYLRARWHELNGEPDIARAGYYNLWRDAPDSVWGALAKRKLEPLE